MVHAFHMPSIQVLLFAWTNISQLLIGISYVGIQCVAKSCIQLMQRLIETSRTYPCFGQRRDCATKLLFVTEKQPTLDSFVLEKRFCKINPCVYCMRAGGCVCVCVLWENMIFPRSALMQMTFGDQSGACGDNIWYAAHRCTLKIHALVQVHHINTVQRNLADVGNSEFMIEYFVWFRNNSLRRLRAYA